MPEAFEQHFAAKQGEDETPEQINGKKTPEQIKEEKGLALVQEIEKIKQEMQEKEESVQGYQKISELLKEIDTLYKPGGQGWKLELEEPINLTEDKKYTLAEFQAGSFVYAANFNPEGDKIVIGSDEDHMARVISLTEKDPEGKPKVLAEFQAGGVVWAANFNPEGDKIVIGSGDRMARVIGENNLNLK